MAGYSVSTSLSGYTDIDALLKEKYDDRLYTLIMVGQKTLGRFGTKTVDGGRRSFQAVELSFPAGAMAVSEGKSIPAPVAAISKDMIVYPGQYLQRGRITQHAITQGRGTGAITDALTRFTTGIAKGFRKGLAHDVWSIPGSIRGARAVVGATAAATAQNVRWHGTALAGREEADVCGVGNQRLMDGMNIYWNDSATIIAGSLAYDVAKCGTVSSRGTSKETLTLSAIKTMTKDDVILAWNGDTGTGFEAGYEAAMTPLAQHVDNDTGTYQGLSRDTYPQLRANITEDNAAYKAGTNDLTEMQMLQAFQAPDERIGETPNLMLCSYGVKNKIWETLESMRRFPAVVGKIANQSQLDFNGMVPEVDPDAPPGSLWMLNSPTLRLFKWKEMGWWDGDGKILVRVPDKTELEATYIAFLQLVCNLPPANSAVLGITTEERSGSY